MEMSPQILDEQLLSLTQVMIPNLPKRDASKDPKIIDTVLPLKLAWIKNPAVTNAIIIMRAQPSFTTCVSTPDFC